jgi:hypothetical protein
MLNFGCITLTVSTTVTHKWREGDEQAVWLEVEQQLDSGYARTAHEANVDMQAQYGAEFKPSMRFPEYLDELPSEMQMLDPATMQKQGFAKRGESIYGVRYGKRFSLDEYAAFMEGKTGAPAPHVTVEVDSNSGVTRYRGEFTLAGLGEPDTWDKWDWDQWDQWKATPQGPKPKADLTKPKAEVEVEGEEAKRALAFSGLDQVLSGAFSALSDVSPTPLQEWWAERIVREMGIPTMLRFEINLPGTITRHEMNGREEGQVAEEGKAVFEINEAFVRKHGFTGPWTFVVESEVEPGPPPKLDDEETKPATRPAGATYRRFRLRAVGWAYGANGSLLLKRLRLPLLNDLAPFVAYYELTELDSEGLPVRQCKIRFVGTGLSIGLPVTAGYAQDSGSEFSTRRGASLEDFDGISGSMTSGGALIGAHSKVTFGGGLLSHPDEQLGSSEGWGWFWGAHAGWSPMSGRWDIVEAPRDVTVK